MNSLEGLIAAEEAANALGVTVARLYDLTRSGLIPAVRIGRSVRYSPPALRLFVERGGASWPGGWRKEATERDVPK